MVTNPFSDIDVKYIPAFLLHKINDQFLVRQTEKIYELQHSSFAIPPSIYNFRCYEHLERMRESYVFVVYFVITDSLFYFVPIIVSTFCLVRFFQELQKSLDFQRSSSARSQSATKQKRGLWTLSRSVFAFDCLSFLLSLIVIICFTIYWVVIDSDAVFLFETAHCLNVFLIIVVSVYFSLRTIGLWIKIGQKILAHTKSAKNKR